MSVKTTTLSLAVVLATAATIGCGGGEKSAPVASAPVASVPAAPAGKTADIKGVIKFEGTAPAAAPVKMGSDAFCAGAGKGQMTEDYAVDGGMLGNVFVYLKEGVDMSKVPAAEAAPVVVFDQKGCWYQPHVFGVRVGQKVEIRNSDDTMHNVHSMAAANDQFNNAMQKGAPPIEKIFTAPEMGAKIKCDVHSWMGAYANVVEHPYFAVSGKDGSFTISGIPAGQYKIAAWHEKMGEQVMDVTVTEAGAAADFTFKK